MGKSEEKPAIRMLATILDHKQVAAACAVFKSFGLPFQYMCHGAGTASNEWLDFLGLVDSEKAILLSIVPKSEARKVLHALDRELTMYKPGHGIAFTFPVSGTSAFIMTLLKESIQRKIMEHLEHDDSHLICEADHRFLICIINQGYSDDVMSAARSVGARGGTVIHARRLGDAEPLKRWGIGIQEEKEIVFIITETAQKLPIMKAIVEKCGVSSKAQAIVLSIPVDAVAGLPEASLDAPQSEMD